METTPYRILCVMTLMVGVSYLQSVLGRDGEGKRPLEDVFSLSDREVLESVSATMVGRTEKQKNPHPSETLAFST